MNLTVLDPNLTDHWMEVHRTGCQHLSRRSSRGPRLGAGSWTLDADTLRQATEEIAGDFIFFNDEQPWTDYVDEIHWAPCVKLPRE